jgi:hypothetical protein
MTNEVFSMHDKFVRGYIAGIFASFVMMAINLASFSLGIAKVRYLDVSAVILWGEMPKVLWETVFAQMIAIFFCGLIGITYTYLLPKLGTAHRRLKGATYTAAFWFTLYAIGTFLKVPLIEKAAPETCLSNLVSSSIFGLVLDIILQWEEKRIASTQQCEVFSRMMPTPVYKYLEDPPNRDREEL